MISVLKSCHIWLFGGAVQIICRINPLSAGNFLLFPARGCTDRSVWEGTLCTVQCTVTLYCVYLTVDNIQCCFSNTGPYCQTMAKKKVACSRSPTPLLATKRTSELSSSPGHLLYSRPHAADKGPPWAGLVISTSQTWKLRRSVTARPATERYQQG